jgi:hypothetical protein
MSILTIGLLMWKATFHIIALVCIFKVNDIVGFAMTAGILLHQLLSLYIMRGKKLDVKIVNK